VAVVQVLITIVLFYRPKHHKCSLARPPKQQHYYTVHAHLDDVAFVFVSKQAKLDGINVDVFFVTTFISISRHRGIGDCGCASQCFPSVCVHHLKTNSFLSSYTVYNRLVWCCYTAISFHLFNSRFTGSIFFVSATC